ncbi:hypothetical protein P7K49_014305 [Saguinus oedipus]|uniref:Uncharacterized protein n=1 Tax=Saguinus oedipus TaxID=9490 RepID=A0ABQ9VJ81_SAGOE|nr:hypothetical protein P7K49_014305 [Saguinus oedipus]
MITPQKGLSLILGSGKIPRKNDLRGGVREVEGWCTYVFSKLRDGNRMTRRKTIRITVATKWIGDLAESQTRLWIERVKQEQVIQFLWLDDERYLLPGLMMFPLVDGETGTKMTKLEQQDLMNPELINNTSLGMEAKKEIPGEAKAQICEIVCHVLGKIGNFQ